MPSTLDRRRFLGGLAALSAAPLAFAQQPPAPLATDDGSFRPDTLFLTWQGDPTTTVTVQWIGKLKEAGDPVLRFRDRGDDEWQLGPTAVAAPFPVLDWPLVPLPSTAELSVFRGELTGLTPGREYEFRIGLNATVYRFRTMPAKATKAFTFVSGGDCGVNAHAAANNRIAAAQDPMFCLIGGDLGYDNGISGHTAVQFIRQYASTMTDSQGRLIPLVTCVGNHEVRGGYGKTLAEATFFTPLFGGLFRERSYAALDFGDYLSLVLLDSGHCAKIAGEQTEWLNQALADRAGRPHLIPVNHVPAYPSYRPPETGPAAKKPGTGADQRTHWVPLFEKHQVDVVLEHHDHTFKRTHPLTGGSADAATGIVYLGDGSWGKLRVPKKAESRPYLAEISTRYHLTLHRLEGEQRFHLALGETGKVLDVYRTGKKPRRRTPGVTTG